MIAKCSNPFVRENNVVPIEPILARIKIRPGKPSSPEIQRVQFPVTLAYAVTIHKVQGLSLEKVVISFELFKQRSFNNGQVYVALSRSTSINGIYILGELQTKHVRADPRVHKEYERLRETSPLHPQNVISEHNSSLIICVLNVRSLQKHSIDVKYDPNIFNADMMCFTETQLLPSSNDNEIKNNLHPFTLYRQDHASDRYSSLAICSKNLDIKQHHYFPDINALKFVVVNDIIPVHLTILLLYRKHGSSISQYINNIRCVLNSHEIDIILGDFNINYFNDNEMQQLNVLMGSSSYKQTVQSPTFISTGSLLDHVYVRNEMLGIIDTSVATVYYSDHDAIKISLDFI